jgi:hypothetical protein
MFEETAAAMISALIVGVIGYATCKIEWKRFKAKGSQSHT